MEIIVCELRKRIIHYEFLSMRIIAFLFLINELRTIQTFSLKISNYNQGYSNSTIQAIKIKLGFRLYYFPQPWSYNCFTLKIIIGNSNYSLSIPSLIQFFSE